MRLSVRRCLLVIKIAGEEDENIFSRIPWDNRGYEIDWSYTRSYFDVFVDFSVTIHNPPESLLGKIDRRGEKGLDTNKERPVISIYAGYIKKIEDTDSLPLFVSGEVFYTSGEKSIGSSIVRLECTTLPLERGNMSYTVSGTIRDDLTAFANSRSLNPLFLMDENTLLAPVKKTSYTGAFQSIVDLIKKKYSLFIQVVDYEGSKHMMFADETSLERYHDIHIEEVPAINAENGMIEVPVHDTFTFWKVRSIFRGDLDSSLLNPISVYLQSDRVREFHGFGRKVLVVSNNHEWSNETTLIVSPSGSPVDPWRRGSRGI